MPTLHIYRSKPDKATEKLLKPLLGVVAVKVIKLYEGNINWNQVVDELFKHEKVICWW